MKLIVDTSCVISALIRDSASRRIIYSDKIELVTINVTKKEIDKHKDLILKKANITEDEFKKILHIFFNKINIIDDILIGEKMKEARSIMDDIDPDDTQFIAAALATDNYGIWSNDKHFQKQDKVKVWKTEDLVKYLKSK